MHLLMQMTRWGTERTHTEGSECIAVVVVISPSEIKRSSMEIK